MILLKGKCNENCCDKGKKDKGLIQGSTNFRCDFSGVFNIIF